MFRLLAEDFRIEVDFYLYVDRGKKYKVFRVDQPFRFDIFESLLAY